jgi:hypothetical protein
MHFESTLAMFVGNEASLIGGTIAGMCWTIALCLRIVHHAHAQPVVQIKAFFPELFLHSAGMRELFAVVFCPCQEDGLSTVRRWIVRINCKSF